MAHEDLCCKTNGYHRIFPTRGRDEKFAKFLNSAPALFGDTASSKARHDSAAQRKREEALDMQQAKARPKPPRKQKCVLWWPPSVEHRATS